MTSSLGWQDSPGKRRTRNGSDQEYDPVGAQERKRCQAIVLVLVEMSRRKKS